MKRTEFRLLPVPAELFDELGFTEDMTLEAFVEERRLVLQKADEEDTFCGAYDEEEELEENDEPELDESAPFYFSDGMHW